MTVVAGAGIGAVQGAQQRISHMGALPGVLMFIGGLALMYWALSGWGLFGLGAQTTTTTASDEQGTGN